MVGTYSTDLRHDHVLIYHGRNLPMMYFADSVGPLTHHHVTLRFEPGYGFGLGFKDRRAPQLFDYQNELKVLALLTDAAEEGEDEEEEEEGEEDE